MSVHLSHPQNYCPYIARRLLESQAKPPPTDKAIYMQHQKWEEQATRKTSRALQ